MIHYESGFINCKFESILFISFEHIVYNKRTSESFLSLTYKFLFITPRGQ